MVTIITESHGNAYTDADAYDDGGDQKIRFAFGICLSMLVLLAITLCHLFLQIE